MLNQGKHKTETLLLPQRPDYCNKLLLNKLTLFATESNLVQVVDFNTWSCTVKGIKKESLLDHVYLNNYSIFSSVYFETPIFGDHALVITKLCLKSVPNNDNISLKRKWSDYSTQKLRDLL